MSVEHVNHFLRGRRVFPQNAMAAERTLPEGVYRNIIQAPEDQREGMALIAHDSCTCHAMNPLQSR